MCVCVCGLDERVRSPRDCVRRRQLAFDDRQCVPDSTAGASLFDSISPVAAVDCPFGQLVGRFHSVRSHYANSRPSRSYPPQGETGPSVRLSVVDLIERPRGPGAWLAQCVEQFRMSVPMTTPCWSSTSCREGTSRVVAALISMIDFRCSSSPLSANVSSFIRLFFSFQFLILQRDLLLPRRCSRVQHHHLQHRKSMISATSPTMPPRCQSPLSQGKFCNSLGIKNDSIINNLFSIVKTTREPDGKSTQHVAQSAICFRPN